MVIDSHGHMMLPTEMQLKMVNAVGVDQTILFCSTPHPERASSLNGIEEETSALYKVLTGNNGKEANIIRRKNNINNLVSIMKKYPNHFLGFDSVPLGMSLAETKNWINDCIMSNSLLGVGEFTPGNGQQVSQLDTVLQAIEITAILPVWVHALSPAMTKGVRLLMELYGKYPHIPVIFEYLGRTNWIEVIEFTKAHHNVYLDLSAVLTLIATKMALVELPEECLFSSGTPYDEPYLYREPVKFISFPKEIAELALGNNIKELLHI